MKRKKDNNKKNEDQINRNKTLEDNIVKNNNLKIKLDNSIEKKKVKQSMKTDCQ